MSSDLIALIRTRREQLGYTKARLARAASISDGYMVQIESGQRHPSMDVLTRLAVALALPPVQLWEAAGLIARDEYEAALESAKAEARSAMGRVASLDQEGGSVPQGDTEHAEAAVAGWLNTVLAGMVPPSSAGDQGAPGPEGWADLSASDRRLVQQLVSRLRATATPTSEE